MNGLLRCCGRPVVGEELRPRQETRACSPASPAGGALWVPSGVWVGDAPRGGPLSARTAADSATPRTELLVDAAAAPLTARSEAPLPTSADKASERLRLQEAVAEFVRDAGRGRTCSVLLLDAFGSVLQPRRRARYELSAAGSFVVERETVDLRWERFGVWPLSAVLGAYSSESSALVSGAAEDLERHLSGDELSRAALVEFAGGRRSPLLMVEESVEHRDRLVAGLKVLRLCRPGVVAGAPSSPLQCS